MQIQLEINEQKASFFLEYLHSLRDGIIEKIVIDDTHNSFVVNSEDEVLRRVKNAEKSGDYQEHESFWEEFA